MGTAPKELDRRERRRLETIDEILEQALAVMSESGVAGLSLGEVARRMGVQPPSLYQYFASKHAVYDALFQRGWDELNATMAPYFGASASAAQDARQAVEQANATFVRWAIEHPVLAQLMFWRPVPGFEPTAESYASAVATSDGLAATLRSLVAQGHLRADADGETARLLLITMVAGVITQQLANEPEARYDDGTFTALVPVLTDLFLAVYGPEGAPHDDDHPGKRRRASAN